MILIDVRVVWVDFDGFSWILMDFDVFWMEFEYILIEFDGFWQISVDFDGFKND